MYTLPFAAAAGRAKGLGVSQELLLRLRGEVESVAKVRASLLHPLACLAMAVEGQEDREWLMGAVTRGLAAAA